MEPADLALRQRLKRELRKRRRQVRGALPQAARVARSARATDALLALPEWDAASTVLAFVSMAREVQLGPAVEAAWRAGKAVAAPALSEDREALVLRAWGADTALEESGLGFLEPPAAAPRVEDGTVDLVLVPALAVDARGHRIGYGRGFYDRLLPRLPRAVKAALIFDFELMTEVPEAPWDVPVDLVVTDARVLRVGAAP